MIDACALTLAVCLAPLIAPDDAPGVVPGAVACAAKLEIRSTPIVDMYFYVRWLASNSTAAPADVAGLDRAVEAATSLQQELGTTLGWGPLEGLLGACATAKDVRTAFAGASETLELRSGKKVELRKGAVRLAEALEPSEAAYLEKIWPAHQSEIRRAESEIATGFQPKAAQCLDYVAKHLSLTVPEDALAVGLVCEAPAPGAVTQRDDHDRGISFVAVHGVAGTQLFETILHETMHTLDLATKSGSVLDDLRARLEKAGITRQDREWRDVPHTMMFVQAGETIRRLVDPKHEHYGVVAGYYPKVKMVADIERPIWIEYLDGKLKREEATEKIVAAIVAAKPPR